MTEADHVRVRLMPSRRRRRTRTRAPARRTLAPMTAGSALLIVAAAAVKHPLAAGVLSKLSSELGKASLMVGGLGVLADCVAYGGDQKCAANVTTWGMSTMIGVTADAVGVPAGGAIGSAIFDIHMLLPEFLGEKPRPFPKS